MGFWSKLGNGLKKGVAVATTVAPVLPIPDKLKKIIGKVGETTDDVGAVIDEVKPKPPTKPAA